MLKEFVEKIVEMSPVQLKEIAGLTYSDRELDEVRGPEIKPFEVHTLAGLRDLVKLGVEGITADKIVVHVLGHDRVDVTTTGSDAWKRRTQFVRASYADIERFPFGDFMGSEKFIIALQSRFDPTADLEKVLQIAGNLTADNSVNIADDGVGQSATLKKGVSGALRTNVDLPRRVKLAPYRTFREVNSPVSEFVFRLQQNGQGLPQCALFEADGGKWKHDAMLAVKEWLAAELPGVAIAA